MKPGDNATFSPRSIACANCGSERFETIAHAADTLNPGKSLTVASCLNCGLVGLNPQHTGAAYSHYYTTSYFEQLGGDYDAARDKLTEEYRQHLLPHLRKLVDDLPVSARLLDVGAGTGTWLALFRELRPDIPMAGLVALDPSRTACRDLAARFPGLIIHCTTLEENAIAPGSMDAVLCSALIEHFTDPLLALLHLNRIMSEGARLLIYTPSLDPDSLRFGPSRWFKFVHTYYYTTSSLDALASKAGFRSVYTERVAPQPQGILWFPAIVALYEKERALDPSMLEQVRRPGTDDVSVRRATEDALGPIRGRLRVHRWRQFVRRAIQSLTRRRRSRN